MTDNRNRTVSDLCGEKLSEAFVTLAIQRISLSLGPPRFAMLAPSEAALDASKTTGTVSRLPGTVSTCIDTPAGKFSPSKVMSPPKLARLIVTMLAMRPPLGMLMTWRSCEYCATLGIDMVAVGLTRVNSTR